MAIQRLSKATSSDIVSTSSVYSPKSVAKELIENAIDSIKEKSVNLTEVIGHITIEIDKETAGLEYLKVKDDGMGVQVNDRNIMCLNHTSSKIHSVEDLSNGVTSCGFRGEALHLISRICTKLEICTKTSMDQMAASWAVNNSGVPKDDFKYVPGVVGTTVKVMGLFNTTPVRHKFLKGQKQKQLKDIEALITHYSLIYGSIRFQIKLIKLLPNSKVQILDNTTFYNKINRISLFADILGLRGSNWLFEEKFDIKVNPNTNKYTANFLCIMPLMKAKDVPSLKKNMKVLTVNGLPMNLMLNFGKKIVSKINESYSQSNLLIPPTWYISFELPPNTVDFNIEPEKSDVMVVQESILIESFGAQLASLISLQHGIDSDANTPNSGPNMIENVTVNEINVSDFAKQFDHSDDELLIDELESSLKQLRKVHGLMGDNDDDDNQGISHLEPYLNDENIIDDSNKHIVETVQETNDVCETNSKCDEGDWSRSINDDTFISSDVDIPIRNSSSDDITLVKPSISVLNPWTITEHAREINAIDKESNTTLVDNDSSPVSKPPKKIAKTSTKQMSISTFGTYQIQHKASIPPIRKAFNLPKLADFSQNTLNEILEGSFSFNMDKDHRNVQLKYEEEWNSRENIPTSEIVAYTKTLYASLDHALDFPEPQIDSLGIYRIA